MKGTDHQERPTLKPRNPFALAPSGGIDPTKPPPGPPPIPRTKDGKNPFALSKRKAALRLKDDGTVELIEGSVTWIVTFQDGGQQTVTLTYSSQSGLTDGTLRNMAREILGDDCELPAVWCEPTGLFNDGTKVRYTRDWYLRGLPAPPRDNPVKSRDVPKTKRQYARSDFTRVKVKERRYYKGGDKYLRSQDWGTGPSRIR